MSIRMLKSMTSPAAVTTEPSSVKLDGYPCWSISRVVVSLSKLWISSCTPGIEAEFSFSGS